MTSAGIVGAIGRPGPVRLGRLADLEPMLASGLDFARKFDAQVDAAVLDAIDRRVHGG